MKGDFSRDSFDPDRHFARVLLQQGRVLTDADFNEQAAIQQHVLRSFVVDLVGRRWRVDGGFAIGGATAEDFTIGAGRFYLGGIPFENADACCYRTQAAGPARADDGPGGGGDPGRAFVAYLEGWERSVSAAEDPALRDPALGGVDPSVRAQIVWQVRRLSASAARELAAPVAAALRALKAASAAFAADPGNGRRADALFDRLDSAAPRLTVRTAPPGTGGDAAGGYAGVENRLYRIEIEAPGTAGAATFKWSHDNGATVLAVAWHYLGPDSQGLTILERDARAETALREGDRVEISYPCEGIGRRVASLRRIETIDRAAGTLRVSGPPFAPLGSARFLLRLSVRGQAPRAVLRRWDQREGLEADGAVAVVERSPAGEHWIALEDGIEVQFAPGGCYDSGDYWIVPARTATRDVLWPTEADGKTPRAQPPQGICRHRAALASMRKSGRSWKVTNYRPRR